MEEQLDLTLRLLVGFSASITPDELKSVCGRLGHMYHTMGHLLVARTLESEGVALIGNYSFSLAAVEPHILSPDRSPWSPWSRNHVAHYGGHCWR